MAQKQSQSPEDSVAVPKGMKKLKIGSAADSTLILSDSSAMPVADSMLKITADSMIVQPDSVIDLGFSKDTLKHPVNYKARDSIVYDIANNKVYLYGDADVTYEKVDLQAHFVELDWTTNIVTAETDKDTLGNTIGDVNFKDSGNEYKAKKLAYNFTTEKGKVYQVRTKEGDGYMHAEAVKRNEHDEWYGRRGKYTTCDLEHPHYYISAKKMKMVPDKVIVTGPANLVISDIPTPLYVPFGMFPIKKDRKTGIVFPRYGEEPGGRGFYLQEGGYYIYINDRVDLMVTGDIYTKGSFALRASSNYAKRYKFNGNIMLSYGRNRLGDPIEKDYSVSNDFRVQWRHAQDSKARPGILFSSDVNFGTTKFDRNFNYTRQQNVTNSQFNSNITFSKSWAGKPFNLSLNGSHSQSLVTRQIQVTLPNFQFGVSRITPFKPKITSAKKKWYEDIGFSYRMDIQNQVSGYDSTFLRKETLQNARFGILQNVPINTSFNLFKFLTVQPQFNYNERWYFKSVNKNYSGDTIFLNPISRDSIIGIGRIVNDTIYKFKTARDFDISTNLTTRIYGMFQFKKGKLKAIRHVFSPQINMQYRPDFGKQHWGYYREVQADTSGRLARYSIFEVNSGFPGTPPDGEVAGIGLTLNNILDMKVFSKKDTIKNERKIKLLENLNITTFYNFAADSLKLNPIVIRGYTTALNGAMTINMDATFDPYATDSQFRKINTYMWEKERRLTRFTNASLAIAGRIAPKNTAAPTPTRGSEQEREFVMNNLRGFYDFNIPWSVNVNFNLSMSKGAPGNMDTLRLTTAALNFTFDVNITKNWKLDITSGYDFAKKDFIYTSLNVIRNLHCWELRFQYIPYPATFRSYNIQINVKSPVLQELKLSRKDTRFNSGNQF
jgi:hypothetical protein